jgi:transcriptional regulator with XRE-family HTH domain
MTAPVPAAPPPGWGRYVEETRAAIPMTVLELSAATGIDKAVILRWAHSAGPSTPTNETVRKVCAALGRPIREGLVAAGLFTHEEMYES